MNCSIAASKSRVIEEPKRCPSCQEWTRYISKRVVAIEDEESTNRHGEDECGEDYDIAGHEDVERHVGRAWERK